VPNPHTALPVVGMVGGGQLARMTQQAAIALGIELRVLADSPVDSAALVTASTTVGDYRDFDDLAAFAATCDVVTFDHEHVPLAHVEKLASSGVLVYPGAHALPYVQDKIRMRERLEQLGVPVPTWASVESVGDIEQFARTHNWPVVAKAASGGYDGKGVWLLHSLDDAIPLLGRGDVRLFVEENVAFTRELAALVARTSSGKSSAWPVVETVQSDGICVEVVAPAPNIHVDRAAAAQRLALRIADELDVVGLLAVELFETADGIVVNELAMRPHNSGHWTINGSTTSQFEQHLRAVLDWPLGDTAATAPVTVMANILGGDDGNVGLAKRVPDALTDPDVHLHLYGKGVRPGRKIGHVNICGDDVTTLRARAARAADQLRRGAAT
jgi:5-(carboxyamino)imidazole ribonucleotide synthase